MWCFVQRHNNQFLCKQHSSGEQNWHGPDLRMWRSHCLWVNNCWLFSDKSKLLLAVLANWSGVKGIIWSRKDTIFGRAPAIGVTTCSFSKIQPTSSQTKRGVQWACDRYHSAPFMSLTVALTSAISPTDVMLLLVYHIYRDGKFQELPLCPSYHNGPYSIGQRANVEILPVIHSGTGKIITG